MTIAAVLVFTTVTIRLPNWSREGWSSSYFGVVAPPLERKPSSMVLMAGLNALSFLVPQFPPDVRFIRLQSNGFLHGMTLGGFYADYGQGLSPNRSTRS